MEDGRAGNERAKRVALGCEKLPRLQRWCAKIAQEREDKGREGGRREVGKIMKTKRG